MSTRKLTPLELEEAARAVGTRARGGHAHITVVEPDVEAEPWPEPREIPTGLAPVDPLRIALLPEVLQPWINDIAERASTPPDYAAAAAMVGAASVIGRRVTIRPHLKDSWTVIPNLWGAAVGRSGVLKSPSVKEALKPIKRLEVDVTAEYVERLNYYEAEKHVVGSTRKPSKTYIEAQRKLGRALEDIAKQAAEEPEPERPPRRRLLVNDSTYEKLGEILRDNPNGTLIYRDELVGLLRYLDREGQESARAFYLEAWSGDGRYEFNRIGRGDVLIPNCGFSVFGSIQPGPIGAYLRGALGNGGGADGLMQRFQLAVWPDSGGEWRYVDRYPDTGARQKAFEAYRALSERDPDDVGGLHDQFSPDDPPYMRWSEEAHEAFLEWRGELEVRIRSGKEHPAIESHLAKYRSLLPTVALVCHLLAGHSGDVGIEEFVRGEMWVKYLESHARRLYGSALGQDTGSALVLAEKIRDGAIEDGFRARDVYRHCWTGLAEKAEVESAVEWLIDLGWLREEEVPTGDRGGRPTTRYWINPQIKKGLGE